MKEKIWLHGEVAIKKTIGNIPEGAKKINPVDGVYKIADSETTGNHHLLEEMEGIDVYEKDGMFYVRPSKPMTVRCVDQKRHDNITLEPCTTEEILVITRQSEVDHLTEEVRAVRD